MVVAHNMMAMNAQRQFNIVGNSKKKSTEKLSSGYRINRAADDAAGLSISEKMRRQIRGLNQGANNTMDGISLLQVADGALAEVHDMLHRVTELSVQAANGTYTTEDREAIQQEIGQIMSEINRISDTTEFNERPLFQGADGVTIIPAEYEKISINTFKVTGTPTDTTPTNYKIEAYSSGFKINGEAHSWSEFRDGGNNLSDSYISPGTYSFNYKGMTLSLTADGNAKKDDAVKLLNGAVFASKVTGTSTKKVSDIATISMLDPSIPDLCGTSVGKVIGKPRAEFVEGYVQVRPDTWDMLYFYTGIADADGDEIYYSAHLSHRPPNIKSDIWSNGGNGALVAPLNYHEKPAEFEIDARDYTLFMYRWDTKHLEELNFKINIGEDTTLDTLLKAVTTGDIKYTDTQNADGTTTRSITGIGGSPEKVITSQTIGLGGYSDSGYKGKLIKPEERIHSTGDLDLWIQSGAEVGDGMNITIGIMDADILGLKDLDVTTAEGAGKAIDAADKATKIVSEIRSNIGAQQNRLEHTYKNVTNTAENTQAAESRIRDTDMAKEMVELAKQNILEQVGQSMMAQANQSNQGVLSLLQ